MRSLALFLLALTGCSSTFFDATVTNRSRPVAGVPVSMSCPQAIKAGGPSPLGKTDAGGRLELREPFGGRWIHDGCEIIVGEPGHGERRFPVKSVCAQYSANHCVRAIVKVDLANAPTM